jgi:hypothetical protein
VYLHRSMFRLWIAASAMWVLFWAWRLYSSCTAFADTIVRLSDLEWIVPQDAIGFKVVIRLIAITLGVPIVAHVALAAFQPSASRRTGFATV